MSDEYIELELTQGKVALVSFEDYNEVAKFNWTFDGRYVSRKEPMLNGKLGKKVYLHRYIMKPEDNLVVDHINGDKLDCRRMNMRVCTSSSNSLNVCLSKKNRSGYRGVGWDRWSHIWYAEFNHQGIRYRKKGFNTPREASAWYEEVRKKVLGDKDPKPFVDE